VSIRHARKDPGTLLAWTRTDAFAFVPYYHQQVAPRDRDTVRARTREPIDAATALRGAVPCRLSGCRALVGAQAPGRSGEPFP